MAKVCPKAGRSPFRRKKNCILGVFGAILIFTLVHMVQYDGRYTPLQPLKDAESEAKRLLKFITLYQYQCNVTFQVGNRSQFPICVEKDIGIDIDNKETKILYSIGPEDFSLEKVLAVNHSFQVHIFSPTDIPKTVKEVNNTIYMKTNVVPNDPADFGRNSYGQHTLNDLLGLFKHEHVHILKLQHTSADIQAWEILHYMNVDNLLKRIDQLHIALYIDKIDEDFLYNWYRALYELFYKEGFRLYHTSSSDSLCLQVTMMESCMYYMSWIKDPGPKTFIMYPPADYGTVDYEEERLLDLLLFPQTTCAQHQLSSSKNNDLTFTALAPHNSWQICQHNSKHLFGHPCTVVRFREESDLALEQKLLSHHCSVHTLQPVSRPNLPLDVFRWQKVLVKRSKKHESHQLSMEEMLHLVGHMGPISLLELEAPSNTWDILTNLLNSGIMTNVSQVVMNIQLPDPVHGKHPTVLRSRFSELKRLNAQGFQIFYTTPTSVQHYGKARRHMGEDCCFKLGFVRNTKVT